MNDISSDSASTTQRSPKLQLRERIYRRRFLVPNAVTLANMFCGFLTIIYASTGRFDKAVTAIIVALVLDGLDGRVARRLKATSKFGVEFDSFSDLVSFGIAPAMLMYYYSFRPIADEFGVFVTFVYALCAAARLARFNIQTENLKSFTGLPTPGAAGLVTALVNFAPAREATPAWMLVDAVIMLSLAALMVSNIEFFSIKQLKVHGVSLFILLGAAIALLWYNHQVGLLLIGSAYALSGPYNWLRGKMRGKQASLGTTPPQPPQ